ncbi:MAG: WD40 repeat domain-containing protein [Cyanobacteria bacterium P01_H01_bin.121]
MPSVTRSALLSLTWQGQLEDYVTAIAWSPNNRQVAIASAAGEVLLVDSKTRQTVSLQTATGASINCLGFCHDGCFLAAGGQSGQVQVWQIHLDADPVLQLNLEHQRTWVDQLAWNPTANELAFGLGRYAQVWEIPAGNLVATLPFETSSILGLAWHPQGTHLALSGNQGVKVWPRTDWDADPVVREMTAAGMSLTVSPDGRLMASGNLDRTLLVWPWESDDPWQMQGFPGKVRHLAWSAAYFKPKWADAAQILATASMANVVVWRRHPDADQEWLPEVLHGHEAEVRAIAFQPGQSLLASADAEGQLCLWQQGTHLVQRLRDLKQGFTGLSWSPQGDRLAAGGEHGEWFIWQASRRGQGFSKR